MMQQCSHNETMINQQNFCMECNSDVCNKCIKTHLDQNHMFLENNISYQNSSDQQTPFYNSNKALNNILDFNNTNKKTRYQPENTMTNLSQDSIIMNNESENSFDAQNMLREHEISQEDNKETVINIGGLNGHQQQKNFNNNNQNNLYDNRSSNMSNIPPKPTMNNNNKNNNIFIQQNPGNKNNIFQNNGIQNNGMRNFSMNNNSNINAQNFGNQINSMSNTNMMMEETREFSKEEMKKKVDFHQKELQSVFEKFQELVNVYDYDKEKFEFDRFYTYKKLALQCVENYFNNMKKTLKSVYDEFHQHPLKIKLTKDIDTVQSQYDNIMHNPLNAQKQFFYNEQLNEILELDNLLSILKESIPPNPPLLTINIQKLSQIKLSLVNFLHLSMGHRNKRCQENQQILIDHDLLENRHLLVYQPEFKRFSQYDIISKEIQEIYYQIQTNFQMPDITNIILNPLDVKHFFLVSNSIKNPSSNVFMPSRDLLSIHTGTYEIKHHSKMRFERSKCSVIAHKNFIYVFGGIVTLNRIRTNSCQRYNILEDQWQDIPQMIHIRLCASTCVFQQRDGREMIYVFGGVKDQRKINSTIQIYDIAGNFWLPQIQKLNNHKNYIPRHLAFCQQINQDQIIIFGGLVDQNPSRQQIIQIYNPQNQSIFHIGDVFPNGVSWDFRTSPPVVCQNEIYLLNSLQSQIVPVNNQTKEIYFLYQIGKNQVKIEQPLHFN